jgi:maltoporin
MRYRVSRAGPDTDSSIYPFRRLLQPGRNAARRYTLVATQSPSREGDNVELGKTADIGNGKKLGFMYMPEVWGGNYGTAQGFVAMSGFDFAPEASFWIGQNRLRLQEVHIVDSFLMDYGDNTGVGMTGLDLGSAKLGIGLFNSGTFDYSSIVPNNARRINIDCPTSDECRQYAPGWGPGGQELQMGSSGGGLSVSHNQSDQIPLANTFFLQGATGHAAISGKFQGLGDAATGGQQPGMKSFRIADALDWQHGPFGGQALAAYQTARSTAASITDTGILRGRPASYAMQNRLWPKRRHRVALMASRGKV